VCNPGFSDNYRHSEACPPGQVEEFVQEALDALEYALGPVDSTWGAKRAANGHPAPFPLRYIEIGNEASGEIYETNYRRFYDAIKAKYPQLTIISNQDFRDRLPVEMVDHHKYGSPDSFFAAAGAYDAYDRGRPPVYVGEYGCKRDVGQGNLMAALSEAAYLLGLERNSDVVKMSSYAPLFFHVNDIAWPVNMIGFDSSRVFGRSSYYVQKLFAEHRPDEILRTEMTPQVDGKERALYVQAGIDRETGELVIKVVNRSGGGQRARFQIDGFDRLATTARVTTLGHEDPTVENSLFDPEVIVPQASSIDEVGPTLTYLFSPYSLTILTIRTN
jgi:alpha-N-arabinofuranosidase